MTPDTPAVTESLRERMSQAAYGLGGFTQDEARMMMAILDVVVPIAEAELQKKSSTIQTLTTMNADAVNKANLEILSWKARAEQNASEWEAANRELAKLRDQGCEFCDATVDDRITDDPELAGSFKNPWICGSCWNEEAKKYRRANQLLDQTIEVLESAPEGPDFEYNPLWWVEWHIAKCEPLLDNLKARKGEAKSNG